MNYSGIDYKYKYFFNTRMEAWHVCDTLHMSRKSMGDMAKKDPKVDIGKRWFIGYELPATGDTISNIMEKLHNGKDDWTRSSKGYTKTLDSFPLPDHVRALLNPKQEDIPEDIEAPALVIIDESKEPSTQTSIGRSIYNKLKHLFN